MTKRIEEKGEPCTRPEAKGTGVPHLRRSDEDFVVSVEASDAVY